jgi:hypothetical protein
MACAPLSLAWPWRSSACRARKWAGSQRPFIDGGDGELVPALAHFRARQAEDLHGHAIRLMTDGGPELLAQAQTIVVPGWRGIDSPVPEALCAGH